MVGESLRIKPNNEMNPLEPPPEINASFPESAELWRIKNPIVSALCRTPDYIQYLLSHDVAVKSDSIRLSLNFGMMLSMTLSHGQLMA